jgi:hypothetical protein
VKKPSRKNSRKYAAKPKRERGKRERIVESKGPKQPVAVPMSEDQKNQLITEAHERLFRSAIQIRDVYGVLDPD